MAVVIRGLRDQVPVHGPVVVFAESQAVSAVVVGFDAEWDEVGGVDEADVVGGGEFDPETAGGALVVVDFQDFAAESRAAAKFGFFISDFGRRRWWIVDGGLLRIQCRHQQQGLVGLLVRSTLLNRRGADVQVVKAFDSSGKEHRPRKAENLIAGKRKGRKSSCFGDSAEPSLLLTESDSFKSRMLHKLWFLLLCVEPRWC